MNQSEIKKFLTQSISKLKGVGIKTVKILKKKELRKYLIYYGIFLKDPQIDQM